MAFNDWLLTSTRVLPQPTLGERENTSLVMGVAVSMGIAKSPTLIFIDKDRKAQVWRDKDDTPWAYNVYTNEELADMAS
jgi:hypothetical protein